MKAQLHLPPLDLARAVLSGLRGDTDRDGHSEGRRRMGQNTNKGHGKDRPNNNSNKPNTAATNNKAPDNQPTKTTKQKKPHTKTTSPHPKKCNSYNSKNRITSQQLSCPRCILTPRLAAREHTCSLKAPTDESR